jgi:peptidoglycan hydrolase-like protein with peptidoglycan-binding domain
VRRRAFLRGLGGLAAVGVAGTGGAALSGLLRPAQERADASTAGSSETSTTNASNRSSGANTNASNAARNTAKVTRRDLVQTEQADGRLSFGDTRTLSGGPQGTITALPTVGSVIDRGANLWEVDGHAGPALFFGERPMWRPLLTGVTRGEDVRQLEANLVALGFANATALGDDDKWTYATTTAVRKWQKARGLDQTGRVDTTDVIYAGAPVRVSAVKASVGDRAGSGPVLDVTGAEQIVLVKLDTSKAAVAKAGDGVKVKLEDGSTVDATIRTVGTVVHADTNGGGGTSNYVEVDIALGGRSIGYDDAPVTVAFTRSSATGVLAVPVRALLALAEGGYAVERVDSTGTELVGVQVGVFADGYVAVTGSISAGDTVVVA